MFAKHLQHVGKQCDAGSEKNQAGHIQRISMLAVIRQVQVNQDQTGEANRNIHEENQPPVQVSDDESAGDWSQHGADQTGDGDEAHGANQF